MSDDLYVFRINTTLTETPAKDALGYLPFWVDKHIMVDELPLKLNVPSEGGLTGKYSITYKTCCLESEREVYELR
jgi:hypothetical protein